MKCSLKRITIVANTEKHRKITIKIEVPMRRGETCPRFYQMLHWYTLCTGGTEGAFRCAEQIRAYANALLDTGIIAKKEHDRICDSFLGYGGEVYETDED